MTESWIPLPYQSVAQEQLALDTGQRSGEEHCMQRVHVFVTARRDTVKYLQPAFCSWWYKISPNSTKCEAFALNFFPGPCMRAVQEKFALRHEHLVPEQRPLTGHNMMC